MIQPGPATGPVRQQAIAAVEAWVAEHPELAVERTVSDGWFTTLAGESKRTIGMHLSVGDHTLIIESHFMRAPDENTDALYQQLLMRNRRTYVLRFCIYDSGDVMLVGVVPLAGITSEEVDRIAGALLTTADESYNTALRLGFASYIEREQAWREDRGMGRNPIS